MRNPLGAARAAAGASGIEHLIKQSQGHPAQRYILKAHEAFRDAHRVGIGQDNSSTIDHANGMKALRQAHAVAKATSPKGPLHQAIKTALDKKKALRAPKALAASAIINHTKEKEPSMKNLIIAQAQRLGLSVPTSLSASGFTKEEFMAAAEEFYNHNHGDGGRFSSGPGGGGGPVGGGGIKHRLSAKRIQQGARRADYLNKKVGAPDPKTYRLSAKRIKQGARRADYLNKKVGTPNQSANEATLNHLIKTQPKVASVMKKNPNYMKSPARPGTLNKAPKKSGNYTTKPLPNHPPTKKSGNYTTKPLPSVAKPSASGIAGKIAAHNAKNPKKSGNYITKQNAASIAAAEKRQAAKKAGNVKMTYPSGNAAWDKKFESAFAEASKRRS